jgi:Domain of unknown function (DUF6985)/Leucine Rich repeat
MNHRVFGRIKWDKEMARWTGQVKVDFFSSYDKAAEGEAEKLGLNVWWGPAERRHDKGEFELWLLGSGRSGPSTRQEEVFLSFLDNRDEICGRVADAIYDFYRASWGSMRGVAKPGAEKVYYDEVLIPELSDRDGLKNVIMLNGVTVIDFPEDDVAVVGFRFECTWDIEHGLGVLVRGGKVVKIADSEITWNVDWCPKELALEPVTKDQIEIQRRIAAVRKSGVEMDYPSGWNDLTPELLDAIGAIRKLGGTINRVFGEAGEDTVQISFLGNAQINDDHLIALRHFPSLSQLQLESTQITDGGLASLQEFKDLRLLKLSGARITDSGLKSLHGFKKLKDLYLSNTRITDEGLKELRQLPSLSGLHLAETSVTDAGMKEIGAFTGMKHLDLTGTRITDAGFRELKDLRALLSLDLQGTQVTDSALTTVKEFKSLRYLSLSYCNVTDLGLEQLKEMKTLRSLKLVSTATTDEGVADLQRALAGLQVVR